MPRVDLAGKPILITGASAGIGRATAVLCARAGMPVFAAARREDRLAELVEQIRANGGAADYAVVDVADAQQCAAMHARAREALGPIYAVFANAGYGEEAAIHEMDDARLRTMFEVNFFGSLNTVRPALAAMLERGEGHILFCSSCVAKFTLPFYGAYCATKAAQNHIARAMRLELEPHGVHVSSVHPVGTKTEFFDVAKERSGGAPLVEHSPDRFLQSPDRVARAVLRCLRRPRPEVWTSPLVQWGMAVAMPIPRIADA
ncbi:MAG: SDR family NAD(P)-dependent oxidoreductase, partial [Planctomycetota bacterium]